MSGVTPSPGRAATSWMVVLGALVYLEFVATFETMMIYGAIGMLYRLFGDPVLVGWVITIYMLVSACLVPLVSRLGDLYGRREMTIVVMSVVAVGSFISAISPNIEGLLIGRALQGAAGAVLPLCYGLVREHMPAERMDLATGIVAGTLMIASGVGVFAGGLIVDHLPWHAMFYIAGVASVIAIAVGIWVLPKSRHTTPDVKLDVPGAVLMMPMIACSLYAIGQIKSWGIGDPRVWMLLGFSLVVGVIWFRREWNHEQPMIDVRLLANRHVLLVNLVMAIAAYGTMQSGPFISMLLQQRADVGTGFGLTASVSGLLMAITYLMGMFAGPVSGFISMRFDATRALQSGALLASAGWVAMAIGQNTLWLLLTGLFTQAIGTVMILAAIPMVLAKVVPMGRTSEANGVVSLVRQANIAIALQITAFVLSTKSVTVEGSSYPAPEATTLAFVLLAGTTVLCFLISLLLPRFRQAAAAPAAIGVEAMTPAGHRP